MSRISLKSLVKRNDTISLITTIAKSLGCSVRIKDDKDNELFAIGEGIFSSEYPISADNEIIGFVEGTGQTIVIAQLLNQLVSKEAEKKRLGSEILNLYQEINLIFNFSEKLAKTIDHASISSITLQEARNVLRSEEGAVILWNEKEQSAQLDACSNENFIDINKFNADPSVLQQFIFNGQSEIVPDTEELKRTGIFHKELHSVIYAPLKVIQRVLGVLILGSRETIQYTAADLKLLTTLALQASAAIESSLLYEKNIREAKEREDAMRLVYEATGKFVPYEFIGSLGHKVLTEVKLGDQVEKIVTVLFCDIRDYTTISEEMTPEENFRFVCAFNERMGPAIRRNKGFINQYLGDAIMAIFPGNAMDALGAAIEMQQQVNHLNKTRVVNNLLPIQIGIGMHTGPLIMGITGDEGRMDAATISDTVNTASRLENLTKYYKASIVVSEACVNQVTDKEQFHLRYLGPVRLKGKKEPVHIHECFANDPEPVKLKKQKTLPLFNMGVENYLNSHFADAATAFMHITNDNPGDLTSQFFLSKAHSYLNEGAPIKWSGIVEMENK